MVIVKGLDAMGKTIRVFVLKWWYPPRQTEVLMIIQCIQIFATLDHESQQCYGQSM